MKYNRTFSGVLLFGLILLICLWFWQHGRRINYSGDPTVHTEVAQQAKSKRSAQGEGQVPPETVSPSNENPRLDEQRQQQIRASIGDNNVAIRFYGKVVDQDDKPLSEVKIRVHVRTWLSTGGRLSDFPKLSATSSPNGIFEIDGANGDVLTIDALEKDGYEAEPGAMRGYGYNTSEHFLPNPDKPVVLRMWKIGAGGVVVTGRKFFKVAPDGKIHFIDLVKGEVADTSSAESDLSVWIKRPEQTGLGERYDWSFLVKAVDGGLREEPDRYTSMYLAPSDGYTNAFECKITGAERGWSDGIAGRRFYLRSRGGKVFGRLEIEVYASYGNSGTGRVWIDYAINPSGVRGLIP